jgi:hypothetical protein
MKYINLYQAAFHPPRVILPARRLLAGGLLFLGALVALYAWDAWRLARLRQEVSQVVAQAARLEIQVKSGDVVRAADPRVLAEAGAVETRLHNLQLAQDALASGALGSETGYAAWFRALARVHSPGAWLTLVEISDRGHEMNLRGRALTGEDSARLIAGLRREPLFVGLSFASLTLAPPADKGDAAEVAKARTATPARFLEFALSAHLVKEAPAAAAAPGSLAAGLPPMVTLPEMLAKQAAQTAPRNTP